MSDGYTYTTISARPGERPRIGVAFYLDEHAWITVPGTDDGQAAPAHRARRGVGVDQPASRDGHRRGRGDRAAAGRPGRGVRGGDRAAERAPAGRQLRANRGVIGQGRDGRELAPSGRPWSLPSLAWQGKEVTSVCATRSLASSTPR